MARVRRRAAVFALVAGMLFQGLSGLWGGSALIADPSGALLDMPLSLLEGTPFRDYLVPGLFLFTVLGMVPLAVAVALWRRVAWARHAALLVSLVLLAWIGVEIALVGYIAEPPLQLVYGLLGAALLCLSLVVPRNPG